MITKPETSLGKTAVVLSLVFTLFILLKILSFMPLPTFAIATIGIAGFISGVIALIQKDRSLWVYLTIVVGVIITFWFAAELILSY